MITHYQPKGGMCLTCIHRKSGCSQLPFKDMYVLEVHNITAIVKCTGFSRKPSVRDLIKEGLNL